MEGDGSLSSEIELAAQEEGVGFGGVYRKRPYGGEGCVAWKWEAITMYDPAAGGH